MKKRILGFALALMVSVASIGILQKTVSVQAEENQTLTGELPLNLFVNSFGSNTAIYKGTNNKTFAPAYLSNCFSLNGKINNSISTEMTKMLMTCFATTFQDLKQNLVLYAYNEGDTQATLLWRHLDSTSMTDFVNATRDKTNGTLWSFKRLSEAPYAVEIFPSVDDFISQGLTYDYVCWGTYDMYLCGIRYVNQPVKESPYFESTFHFDNEAYAAIEEKQRKSGANLIRYEVDTTTYDVGTYNVTVLGGENGSEFYSEDSTAYNYFSEQPYGKITYTLTILPYSVTTIGMHFTFAPCTYSGQPQTPEVTIIDTNGNTLVKDQDYTISYTNNVNAGEGTATITGIGNYTGTITKTFAITSAVTNSMSTTTSSTQPKATLISTVKGKTTMKLSWKKVKNAKRYLVYIKKNGKFKKIKTTKKKNAIISFSGKKAVVKVVAQKKVKKGKKKVWKKIKTYKNTILVK